MSSSSRGRARLRSKMSLSWRGRAQSSSSIEDELIFAKTSSSSIEDELIFARTSSSSIEDELVFDRRRTNRLIKKLELVKYCWMKLVYHNGPNHPAKYGCLGVSSYKVGFSLVNRVSLIFKDQAHSVHEEKSKSLAIHI